MSLDRGPDAWIWGSWRLLADLPCDGCRSGCGSGDLAISGHGQIWWRFWPAVRVWSDLARDPGQMRELGQIWRAILAWCATLTGSGARSWPGAGIWPDLARDPGQTREFG